jgi:hypothetical protein
VLGDNLGRPVAVKNGRNIYQDGSADVTFTISGDREQVTQSLIRHFADAGWHERSTQILNPQVATSFARGWQHRGGGVLPQVREDQATPQEPYVAWQGEWENGRGDLVTYDLGGQGRVFRGYAGYLPHSVAEAARQRTGR